MNNSTPKQPLSENTYYQISSSEDFFMGWYSTLFYLYAAVNKSDNEKPSPTDGVSYENCAFHSSFRHISV